jgi:hypothetical protein
MLDDDQHDGRKCDNPEQGITEFGAGSQIGSPVPRIDKTYGNK